MAIDTFAPEFYLQELSPLEMHEFPWVAMAGSVDMAGAGSGVSWPDLEGSVAVRSGHTDSAAIAYEEMDDQEYSVTHADYAIAAWKVGDRERVERIPAAFGNGMTQANREHMVHLSSIIRAAYRGARLAASGLNAPIRGNATGLDGNLRMLEMLHTGGTGADHPKWGTPEGRLALLAATRRARNFGRRHGWPSRFACLATLEVTSEILALITEDKVNLGSGSIVDSAFTGGEVPMIYGCEFHEDTLAPEINVGAVVGANGGLRMDFVRPGQSVKYLSDVVTVETLRDKDMTATFGRVTRLNGAGQDAARFSYSEVITLAAN